MSKFTLVMGCMTFGVTQGSEDKVSVLDIDSVMLFDNEDDAMDYAEENMTDSYFIVESFDKKDIKWHNGTKKVFNELVKKI